MDEAMDADRGPAGPAAPRRVLRDAIRGWMLAALWLALAASLAVSVMSVLIWRNELREIRNIISERIGPGSDEHEIVLAVREFLRDDVGYLRTDAYFLVPMLGFMRPTALQVIHEGGDCAYRTRAFIVILHQFGIHATKLALYDDYGVPVHAVARVDIPGGPYLVDVLFNLVHEDASGLPLTLDQLATRETLRASIARAAQEGNWRAAEYPLDEYDFEDVRTINWNKTPVLRAAYKLLAIAMGDEVARTVPRPYLTEEPALMLLVLTGGVSISSTLLIWRLRRRDRIGASRRALAA